MLLRLAKVYIARYGNQPHNSTEMLQRIEQRVVNTVKWYGSALVEPEVARKVATVMCEGIPE